MTEAKECISNWISELHDSHPDWGDKQIVAVAYEKCGASKEDFTDGFCPFKVLSRKDFISNLEDRLYSDDFAGLPTSVLVANAVNDCLPKLRMDFPNKSEIEILKEAYQLAKIVLSNSDFDSVKEEPIYFAIYIDNPFEFELELKKQFNKNRYDFTDDKSQSPFFAKDKSVSGSSNVAEIGYERNKLRIFFKNGGGYEYPVPSSWYLDMLNSPSKGSYVWESLRGKTPGRVIDNPNKMTPGGVGGSIVPYFKIKGAAMDPDAMRKSMKGFLKAARKGKAAVGGVPIKRITKPQFRAFTRFLRKGVQRFTPEKPSVPKKTKRSFQKIAKKAGKKIGKLTAKGKSVRKADKSKTEKETPPPQDNSAIRENIKRLRKALKNARKSGLDDTIIRAIENRIKTLEKSLSDFISETTYYKITDDFVDDMHHFKGPVSRAGDFEYNSGIKTKDYDNLKDTISHYSHLPSFDSHHENQILGFAYNFTADPDLYMKDHPDYEIFKEIPYIYTEGYTFDDIEEVADIKITSQTKLPVSFRFVDNNEGTPDMNQDISEFVHLAISVNQTDQDRCSTAGGESCWVQFTQDFIEEMEEPMEGAIMTNTKKTTKKKSQPPNEDFDGEEKEESSEEDEESKEEKKDKEEKDDKKKSDNTSGDSASRKPKGKKKGNSDDMITIPKAEFERMQREHNDFKVDVNALIKREKLRTAATNQIKLDKLRSDFSNLNQVYKLKKETLKEAPLDQMDFLNGVLIPYEGKIDPRKILSEQSTQDYRDDLIAIKEQAKRDYLPKGMLKK